MPEGEAWGQWPARLSAECGPLAAAAWAAIRRRMGPQDEPAAIPLVVLAADLGRSERTVKRALARLAGAPGPGCTPWLIIVRTGRESRYQAVVSAAEHIEKGQKCPIRGDKNGLSEGTKMAYQKGQKCPLAPPPPNNPPVRTGETATERGGEREATAPLPPSLRETLQKKDPTARAELLVQGYLRRAIHRSEHAEASAVIVDDLRAGRYGEALLADYLEATPHVRAWPRELAAAVAAWLNTLNVTAAERRKMIAWSAWRRRLRLLTAGDAVWETDLPHIVWRVVSVDVERGLMTVARREGRDGSGPRRESAICGPEKGAAWAFEIETMPLLRPDPQPAVAACQKEDE